MCPRRWSPYRECPWASTDSISNLLFACGPPMQPDWVFIPITMISLWNEWLVSWRSNTYMRGHKWRSTCITKTGGKGNDEEPGCEVLGLLRKPIIPPCVCVCGMFILEDNPLRRTITRSIGILTHKYTHGNLNWEQQFPSAHFTSTHLAVWIRFYIVLHFTEWIKWRLRSGPASDSFNISYYTWSEVYYNTYAYNYNRELLHSLPPFISLLIMHVQLCLWQIKL